MSPEKDIEFIIKEFHTMNKEIAKMGKQIEGMDVRSQYQEKSINNLIKNDDKILDSIKELNKSIAKTQIDNNNNYNKLVVKVTAISTALGLAITVVLKKISFIGM